MICSIYKITNLINDKVYVGQTWKTIQHRFQEHKNPSSKGCIKLCRAIKKYGKDSFKIDLLVTADNQLTADFMERFWIATYNSIINGYNLMLGGAKGKHSEESKKKMSEKATGRKASEDTKKKLSMIHKGHKLTLETLQKKSFALKGKPWSQARRDAHKN